MEAELFWDNLLQKFISLLVYQSSLVKVNSSERKRGEKDHLN